MSAMERNVNGATSFGALPGGDAVMRYSLTNQRGLEVCFLNLGGIVVSVKVPDRHGVLADVTPGYDSVRDYLSDTHFFGALIGRYANRIDRGCFALEGVNYALPPNDGPHLLHGGANGFHRALWSVEPFVLPSAVGAVLRYTSHALEGSFPGTLDVCVTYTLTDENELCFDYAATTDQATPVNLTQHSYFNLAGHHSGDILDHELTVFASQYLPVNAEAIPTGELRSVEGTPFDFRAARTVGSRLGAGDAGYDHCFACDAGANGEARPVARLFEPQSGRVLEIESTEPALQLYSGNLLDRTLPGKGGHHYAPHSALALETQHYPNSLNMPHFPSTILWPGEEYRSRTLYRFTVA